MNLNTQLLTKNACYQVGKKMVVKGLMLHSTAANNPNLKRYVGPDDGKLGVNKYGNHWNAYHPEGKDIGPHTYSKKNGRCAVCGGRQVCAHGFIGLLKDGTVGTYQTLPWDMVGWHAGGTANNSYIGVEICEDSTNDLAYLKKVYREAVELFAYLCKEFNLDPTKDGVIIDHSEGAKRGIASSHADVMHWWKKHGLTMDDFRRDVAAELGKSKPEVKPPVSGFQSYVVRINATLLNIRSGPGTNYKTVGKIKNGGAYTIVEEAHGQGASKWGKLKSGAGWISLDYTSKIGEDKKAASPKKKNKTLFVTKK